MFSISFIESVLALEGSVRTLPSADRAALAAFTASFISITMVETAPFRITRNVLEPLCISKSRKLPSSSVTMVCVPFPCMLMETPPSALPSASTSVPSKVKVCSSCGACVAAVVGSVVGSVVAPVVALPSG